MNDFPVYQYGPAECCCVPSALINCLTAFFDNRVIPAHAIQSIYRHSLDATKSRGTTGEAIERIVEEISNIGCESPPLRNRFICSARYLIEDEVTLKRGSRIVSTLRRGGTAMLGLNWPHSMRHAVTVLAVDRKYVYCFDPLLRRRYRNRPGCTFLGPPGSVRTANLQIERAWLESTRSDRFYSLGPIGDRDAVILEP